MAEAKWEGKVNVEIASLTVEQHKWFPFLDKYYRVERVPGKPGLVRHVKADEMINGWANDKLLTIDPIQKSFSYGVTYNNIGFNNYVATIKVFLVGADDQCRGCIVEWSFVTDPVPGWTIENLLSTLNYCLRCTGKKMEQTFL